MALESLKIFEYSTKTDVWSYGILLFELFSLGQLPYIGMENSHILEFLEEGKRLDKPAHCSDEMQVQNGFKFTNTIITVTK
jgi:serine/threonine protein kinase